MYLRITTITGTAAGRTDDVITLLRDRVKPLIDGLAGSRGLAAFVSHENGSVVATSAWDTAEDRAASDAALAPLRVEAADLLMGTVSIQELELAVLERTVPASPGCWTRMSRLSTDPSRIDDGIAAFTTQALPVLRAQPGFCTAVMLVDPVSGEVVVATTWSSREALTASAARAQALRTAVAASVAGEISEVSEYEVVLAGIRPPQQHERLFRRAYAAMSAGGDLDALDEIIDEDLIDHAPLPPGTPAGRAGVKQVMAAYRQGVPDMQISLVTYLEQGDLGCAVVKITGTHTGTLLGIAPTGRRFAIDAVDVVRIAGGRAVEHWGTSDDLGMLTQLGAAAPPVQIPGQHTYQPAGSDTKV